MDQKAHGVTSKNFAIDSMLNMVAVILVGIGGLALNVIIASYWDAATLGILNQSFAIFIIAGQLGSLGVQASCLKHLAQFRGDRPQTDAIVVSSLVIVALSACVICGLIYTGRGLIARILGSPPMAEAIVWLLPGLWFFTVDRVLLNVINGWQRMRVYALFFVIRAVALVAGSVIAAVIKMPGQQLPVILSVAEGLIFVGMMIYCKRFYSPAPYRRWARWSKSHLSFGLRSLPDGMLQGLNTRVDVLMLGIFVSDTVVGLYSFAAVLAEGVLQLAFALRKNIDPILTRLVVAEKFGEVEALAVKTRRRALLAMVGLSVAAVGAYPLVVRFVVGNPAFMDAWLAFGILMAGAIVYGGYIPISGLLVQSGYPGMQTLLVVLVAISNIVLNAVLIPLFGINGAAMATAVAFVLFGVYQRLLVNRAMGLVI